MHLPIPADVLAAFDIPARTGETAVALSGGQGRTWRIGDVILKPSFDSQPSHEPLEAVWVADVLAVVPESSEFRVARPVRSASGIWIVHGWEAWQAVAGEPEPRRVADIVRAGRAFHRALVGIARPGFLDTRDDPWSYGDRVAWGEEALTGAEVMSELLMPLARARRPVHAPSQVVHGDLLGNVLFADGLPPAIIDWPVYYRPAAWASAVAVVDAVTWFEAREFDIPALDIPALDITDKDWDQMLVRALTYRIATSEGSRRHGRPVYESLEHYRPVVDLVLNRLASR